MSLRRSSLAWLVALAAITISCNDSPTEPVGEAPAASIRLSDSVFTRGTVIRASVGVPDGYALVAGSATWSVVSGSATLENLGGGDDSVAVSLAAPGPVALGVSYTLRGVGAGSGSVGMTPTRRPAGNVIVETSRAITVAAPIIDFTTLPTASVTAGNPLGDMRVSITDARGRVITSASDSIVIALDATSGGGAGVLLGTLRARATAGVATFSGTSIQKAGTGYRIIASSPTLAARDTAGTSIVAGAPTAAQSAFAVADTIRAVTQTTTVTVTLRDQYGNTALTAAPTAFAATASAGTFGAFTCANGICTATYTAPSAPAAASLSATVGGTAITGAPRSITVTPGTASKLTITGGATQTAGAANALTIRAFDAQGNLATSYTGAKSLTFSGATNAISGTVPMIGGSNQGTATTITFTNGVSAAVSASLYKVETATLAVTDGTIAAAGTDRLAIAVSNAAASATQSSLAIGDSVRAAGLTTTVTVTLKDAYGNPSLDGTNTTFAASATAGTLGAFTCAAGVCTATYTAPATVATHSITATIGGTAILGSPKTVRVPDTTAPIITGPSGAAGAAASSKSIAERGTAVHSFTADEASTWSISGGADAAKFSIVAATGVLTFVAAPDFEVPADADANNTYIAIVRAVDALGNASTQTLTVTVTDVDDSAPAITGPSGAAGAASSAKSIAENTTAVHTFTASESVTWTISGGADAAKFGISAGGALSLLAAPNFETPTDADANNTYIVTITATDAAALANASSQTVTVTVTNVAPVITGPSGAAGAGTSATSIAENSTAVHSFSADEPVTWSITGGADAAKFAINSSTGTLSFLVAPNFESPADADANNAYVVAVTATDLGGGASNQTVTATVTDVDDTAPVITGPSGAAGAASSAKSIAENTTAVHTFTVSESASWSLAGADAAAFAINPTTGVLRFISAPNFESPADADANNAYIVTVIATDAVGNASSQTVTVTVTDVDDTAPAITGPSGAAGAASSAKAIAENTTAVHTFTANESVTWSITGGADAARFTIVNGALAFASAPNFEAPTDAGADNTYQVIVSATDGAGNASTQTVAVTVTDVDDTAPAISGPSGAAGAASSAKSIAERGTAVHTFTASEAVTWSLSGADAAKFAITPATGALSFLVAPDFELPTDAGANNVYDVIVTATDGASNVSTQGVAITVTDVDDTAPVITGPSGAAGAASSAKSIAENTTAVHTFTANESVTWSITGGADAARFTIVNGALAFVAAPNFEAPADAGADNVYNVTVTATDASALANASTQTVAVTVTDVDDTAPAITGPSGAAGAASSAKAIAENTTAVHTFTANESVTWSLTGGADAARFAINPTSGALSFLAAPNFEAPADADLNNSYVATITATDAAGNTSSQSVTVSVADVDDTAAGITGPSGGVGAATSAVAFAERATGTIHTFTANEAVTWTLGGTDAGSFALNPATGALRFIAAPDFEAPTDLGDGAGNNTYVVAISATDASGNVSTQTVTVTVTDVDDTAPAITGPSGSAGAATSSKTINENTTAAHTMTANEAVTWSITGGADAARFTIVGGALAFASAPDFEAPADADANNTYVVTVTATDASALANASSQTVTVTVADVDDTAPAITGPSGSAGDAMSVASIAERTTAVHTMTANEAVTWSLNVGLDAAKFVIDAATGALAFAAAPDFETPLDALNADNVYDVSVRATDATGNVSNQAVFVTVTDVDDTAPAISGPSGAAGDATSATSIAENGTAVHTMTAGEAATWSLDGGADAAMFTIDPATGALTFLAAPDFETALDADANNTYIVTVKATDASLLANASTQTVTVTVTDVDEIAPVISGPSGAAGDATSAKAIDENTTAVHTMTADEAVTWTLTGGADQGAFTISAGGALAFAAAPDFELPTDAGTNNTYEVIVTATDALGNVSTQTVTVTVTNVAPAITGPSGAAGAATSDKSLLEGTTAVHTMTTSDAVGVTWSLVAGADAARFTISAGGALSFLVPPDFETPTDVAAGDGVAGNNVYVVEVQATDGEFTRTQVVTVTVQNIADEGAPDITGPSLVAGAATDATTIDENTTPVFTFSANEAATFSLGGGADQARFTLAPVTATSAALSFTTAPDFESPTDADGNNTYVVILRAVDAAGNASTQTVTVTVNDVDDIAPIITGPTGAAGAATSSKTINENTMAVHTFLSNDGTATWSLVPGGDAAAFGINGAGALEFLAAPDFESPTDADANNTYVVTVRLTDLSLAANFTTQTVTVTVADVDDTAPIVTGPSGATGATSATSLAENRTAVHTFTANETVVWSLNGGADVGFFAIDAATGALTFSAAPDFEVAADAGADNTYEVGVRGTDASGNATTQTVTVTITNVVDETAPQITGPSGAAGAATSAKSIAENVTAVHPMTADEAVTWTLGGADQGKFQITAGGVLSFIAAPDFETPADVGAGAGNNTYEVSVVATDAAGNASTQTVTVTILNVDDTAPAIQGPSGAAGAATSATSHAENAASVFTFVATDPAPLANPPVTFALASGLDGAKFEINAATGELRFLPAPDFETPTDADTNNTYLVRVTATDALGNQSLQTVTVTVTDVDEIAPTLTGPSGAAGAVTSVKSIAENTTAVHTMTSSEAVTWTLAGADAAAFTIAAGPGASAALAFSAAPDYEAPTDLGATAANNTYVVAVTGTDAAGNASTQTVTVTVTNVIDEVNPTIVPPGPQSIPENTTAVVTMAADETVAWSIDGGADAAKFVIDATLGALRFATAPNFEAPTDAGADNVYDVIVKATDPTGNTSTQAVAVTVTNVDDTAPAITGPSGAAGAATSATTYQETGVGNVATFTSDDPGQTWGKTAAFDGAQFNLSAGGVLTFVSSPDFEAPADLDGNNTYQVVITATDALGNVSSQLVTVVVTDLDEISPVITGPTGGAGAATSTKAIAERSTAVHTFTASESVTWSISGGADAGLFTIVAGPGLNTALSFAVAPDFEAPADVGADNTYEVIVTATDGVLLTASQTLTVTITDLDDTAPAITGPSGAAGAVLSTKSINEGTATVPSTAVHTMTANEAVTWAITGGADQARFTINPTTGVLALAASENFESPADVGANNTYEVIITAVDASVLANSSSQTVIVTILDVDENAPVIEGPAPAATGSLTSSITVTNAATAIHTFLASDASAVTWSLVAGIGDVAAFTINATTGALAFVSPRPADIAAGDGVASNGVYVVRVKATDALGNAAVQILTVTVTGWTP